MLAFAARGSVGEAAESGDWHIDQAVAEYEAYCAGELRPSVKLREHADGELQFCGKLEDRSRWTITYVRSADGVITPLAVGDVEHVFSTLMRLNHAGAIFENPRLFPPPAARVGGVVHRFQPAQGFSLVGVAQMPKAAVLLVAIGERIAVVYLEGKSRVVLDVKSPLSLREIDVDRMLGFHRPSRASARAGEAPVQPSETIRAQHLRIVRGVPIDLGGGPSISEVLRACFEDIVRRVKARKELGKKLRGKTKLRLVLGVLLRLGLLGCGDLVGLSGEIIAEIREQVPEFAITAEAFADVLNLMRAAKTCLVERDPKERTWRINLAGLNDPKSALHARLCKETAGCFRIHELGASQPGAGGRNGEASCVREPPVDPRVRAGVVGVKGHDGMAAMGREPTDGLGTSDAPASRAGPPIGDEATRGIEARAAEPDSEDSTTPLSRAGVEDAGPTTSTTVDKAATMILLAAMFALLQMSMDAEQTREAERTAWEAERHALRAQVDAVAEERAELVALREQLAGSAGQKSELLVSVEQAEARVGGAPAEHSAVAGVTAEVEQLTAARAGPGTDDIVTLDPGRAADEPGQHAVLETEREAERAGGANVASLVQAEPHPLACAPAHPTGLQSEPPLADHLALGEPRLDLAPAAAKNLASPDIAPNRFNNDFIPSAGPAKFFGLVNLGSLGPRGPPDRRR